MCRQITVAKIPGEAGEVGEDESLFHSVACFSQLLVLAERRVRRSPKSRMLEKLEKHRFSPTFKLFQLAHGSALVDLTSLISF